MVEAARIADGTAGGPGRPGIAARWRRLSLLGRFSLAGGVVMVAATLIAGQFVAGFMRQNLINQRAAATAFLIDSVLLPELQPLASARVLPPANRARLDGLMTPEELGDDIRFLEVWLPDGTIAYSNSDELIGRRFDLPSAAGVAFRGELVAGFSDLHAGEHTSRGFQRPFTEIYSPIRGYGGREVIAVAEIHESVDRIAPALAGVTRQSWMTVGAACLTLALSLFWIVKAGSETIRRQERELSANLAQARALAERYRVTRLRAEAASRAVTDLGDRLLRNIGADLHDGPLQILGLACLKAEVVRAGPDPAARARALDEIETHLGQTMQHVRDIVRGLVLPEIEDLPLDAVIEAAVASHRARTGAEVAVENLLPALQAPGRVNICLYRLVEEGLNNAFRHGAPGTARLCARLEEGALVVALDNRIADRPPAAMPGRRAGLGLKGLEARIEALGGTFGFTGEGGAARLSMRLPLSGAAGHG